MGFNQHTRGTWVNNMIYNVHLAGRQDFRTGQRAVLADRPAVGVRHGARGRHLAHRLPADMVVTNPSTASTPRNSGNCPKARSTTRSVLHAVAQSRALKDGKLKVLLDDDDQQHAGRAEHQRGDLSRLAQSGGVRRRLEAYPTVSALAADLILPSAMWMERKVPSATPSGARSSGGSR